MIKQKTFKSSISCTGVALHSGDKVSMTLMPGEPGSGIVFKRTDIPGAGASIPATWDNVVETTMCTTLGNKDGVTIATVEHLMAALGGSGIDNAVIEVNGPEVPVMDGSAAPFVFLVECAGTVEQDAPRRFIRVLKAITVEDGSSVASLVPAESFSIDFDIDFESAAISRQSISIGMAGEAFKNEVSRARTFGFLHEVEALRAAGLAKGGSLDNAVVVSDDKVINEDGLRYTDEFVRHKVLDAVGDLYLAGGGLLGHFHGVCTGHASNNKLLQALFADDEAWCYENMPAASRTAKKSRRVWSGDVSAPAIAATA
ncbi:MAG: UDP-3-O-acyl-N-acetylglucosamine deacetylase [Rhodospirillaceae bacterium]|nr:UDP-3-O-acyl-N-acetylglucosamine deacetylase [Rhodospirillaceae bacterium]